MSHGGYKVMPRARRPEPMAVSPLESTREDDEAMLYSDMYYEEEQAAAAVKLQAMQRGKKARKELAARGTVQGNDGDQEQAAAAVKLQAMQRGKKARKELAARAA